MKNIRLVAYVIIGYIIAFFIWWSFLLIRTENERFYLENLNYSIEETDTLASERLKSHQRNKRMIVMEGSVFILLLAGLSYWVVRMIRNRERFLENKKNFLLSAAHELRSPLASLKLNLQTLAKKDLSQPQKERLLELSLKETERLVQLTDKALLVTKIDSDNNKFALPSVNISELYKNYLIEKWPNENRLSANIDPDSYVLGEENILKSVLNNLVENALKYTSGNVQVELKKKMDKIVLTVVDQGPMIPVEEQAKIWDMFYRVGDEMTRTKDGLGLGLYLVKETVENLSGSVDLQGNGQGNVFVVSFKKEL